MPRSRLALILLLPLLLALSAFRDAPLVDPSPIAIPAKIGSAQVAKAVRQALVGRKWTVVADQPGDIKADLLVREHKASIAIHWDAKQIQISYVSSANLKYDEKNGERSIHKNYIGWINNLVTDISGNLTLLSD